MTIFVVVVLVVVEHPIEMKLMTFFKKQIDYHDKQQFLFKMDYKSK